MDNDQQSGWKKFNSIAFDRKSALRRLKKAELASTRHAKRFLFSRLENAKLVRKEITIWAALIGLMIAGVGVQFAFSQRGYMQSAPRTGGSYSEATLGPVENLNPLYVSSSAEASFSRLVFSSLFNHDTTGSLRQDLATNMTIESDSKVYKVDIRRDAVWHDGTPLTAKDVVFTVNLIKNPAVRSPLRINWVDVAVRSVGDYTVEFTLPAAYAAFPYALTFPVLPVHILSDINAGAVRESTFSRAPIGSGPFKYKLLQRSDAIMNHEVIHLVANDNYYGGRARLDQFEIYAYKSQDDIRAAIKGREVNGALDVSNIQAADLGETYEIKPAPLASGVFALFNNSNSILSDSKVRKALQIGTDMASLRKAVGGRVNELTLPFMDNYVWGSDVPMPPAVNVAEAATLLGDAGWKLDGTVRRNAEGTPLRLVITTTKDPQYNLAAEELARQWRVLGLDVTINSVDSASVATSFVQNILQARNFDVLVYELVIGADPDVYAYWHSSQVGVNGYNFANYSNRNADATLATARSRSEPDLRNAKYIAFAKQWLDDAPALALYQPVVEYVVNKNNTAITSSSELISPTDRYANIMYWSVEQGSVYKTP